MSKNTTARVAQCLHAKEYSEEHAGESTEPSRYHGLASTFNQPSPSPHQPAALQDHQARIEERGEVRHPHFDFARILVAVDESEPAKFAVEAAASLAHKTGARVKFVHVLNPVPGFAPEFAFTEDTQFSLLRAEAEWLLRKAQKRLGKGVQSHFDIRYGEPAKEILDAAKKWGADTIVMGTHGRGRLSNFLMGSTAQAVAQRAHCPVSLVGQLNFNRVKAYLNERHARYSTIPHTLELTADRTARTAHIYPSQFAKTLLVKVNDDYAFAVIPANRRLDLNLLRRALGANTAELASESEVQRLFPDCEAGAMPPIGHLYGMNVYVDLPLSHQPQVSFNAGTHDEVIQMSYEEFRHLSPTQIAEISAPLDSE